MLYHRFDWVLFWDGRMSKTETLSIDLLRLDGDTQARIEVHSDTVEEYAELLAASNGKKALLWPFGPVTVYHDGTSYFIADGFHRVLAAHKAKRASVPCDVKKGTARDARFFGMKANDEHGLRMSREDRRKNVVWMLEHYPEMTQANIAANAGVALRTVATIVADRKPKNVQVAHSETTKTSKTKETASVPRSKSGSGTAEEPDELVHDSTAPNTEDAPETSPAKPEPDRNEQAKLNRTLAQSLIDKAVRAVDDLNHVKRNEKNRAAAVKLLQDAGRLLW